MKSTFPILVFILSGFIAFSQADSAKVGAVNPEYDFVYRELFNFLPGSTFGEIQFDKTPLLNKNFNFNLNSGPIIDFNSFSEIKTFSLYGQLPYFNPFINSLSITNQAHYQLNDKLTFGGNSFSGNSIFNPLPANPSLQNMSFRGASMFMQYKLSPKFKVSGSFSISNQNHPFIP
jgi:hypothetical protein